jgi:hypothetical protein
MTVRCPLDCVYLQEAHAHEKLEPTAADKTLSPEVRVTESFLESHQTLLMVIAGILLEASLTEEAIDTDLQEALDATARTYRTLETGLYYQTRPDNLIAARVQTRIREAIDSLLKTIRERGGPSIRDTELQTILVFFQRIAHQWDNHRRYGRAFIDFLRRTTPPPEAPAHDAPLLIQPA